MPMIRIPEGYKSALSVRQTEIAIKKIKDFFQRDLSVMLNLTRVSAPVFVAAGSGLNDNLSGWERPVSFDLKSGEQMEIVHSLAKWKRKALADYGFSRGEGLYTDMNAIRRDEDRDNLHSVFVDQWDWEKIISKEERTEETLKEVVNDIYRALCHTENYVADDLGFSERIFPPKITFIDSGDLEEEFPSLTPKQREYEAVKKYGAVFLKRIGGKLKSGKPHDMRAPDYDDWNLNGDILVYYP
ncbi:MAG: aspartate--ammonia ligase, partial [Candidatus Scatosoma sp.]